jgi:hypothetical protein
MAYTLTPPRRATLDRISSAIVLGAAAATPPSPPPGIPAPAAYTAVAPAATDIGPRQGADEAKEKDLCDRASVPDYPYLAGGLALVVGSIVLDSDFFRWQSSPGVRTIGGGFVGFSWGALVGSLYPAMPKCSAYGIRTAPPEGDVRSDVPVAFAMALLAGATAPLIMGVEQGPLVEFPTVSERATRVVVAGVAGFGAAFLPYLLPPRPVRAMRELEKLRAGSDGHGAWFVGYHAAF